MRRARILMVLTITCLCLVVAFCFALLRESPDDLPTRSTSSDDRPERDAQESASQAATANTMARKGAPSVHAADEPRTKNQPAALTDTVSPPIGACGRVLTVEGEPIAGATVSLLDDGQDRMGQPLRAIAEFQTAPDGTFACGDPGRRVVIEASHPRYFVVRQPWSPRSAGDALEFRLGAAGRIVGTVSRDAGAVPGVCIRVQHLADAGLKLSTISDSQGRFILRRLRPGRYTMIACPSDGPLYRCSANLVVTAGESTEARIALSTRAENRIRGCVTDAANGQPIAGVTVMCFPNTNHRVVTDATGRFELTNLGLGQRVILRAIKHNYLPGSAVVTINPQSDLVQDLVLTRAAVVSGRVIDTSGRPAAFARVAMTKLQLIECRGILATDAEGRFTGLAARPGVDLTVLAETTDGSTGRSRAFRLEPGQNLSEVVVVIGNAARLVGRVQDQAGAAIKGARVTYLGRETRQTTQTDDRGAFLFDRLPLGSCQLTVQADGYADRLEFADISAPKPAEKILTLSRGVALSGKVVDPEGNGVRARLTVRPEKNRSAGVPPAFVRPAIDSDENGCFSIPALPAGQYRLRVRPQSQKLADVVLRQVPSGRLDLLVRLPRQIAVSGRIRLLNVELRPERFWIVAQLVEQGGLPGKATSRRFEWNGGRFTMRLPSAGLYRLSAGTDDGLISDPVTIHVAAPSPPPQTELTLRPGATLSGRVRVPSGEPVEDVTVTLFDLKGFQALRNPTRRVDSRGRFAFVGVQSGAFRVVAKSEGRTPLKGTASVTVSAISQKVDVTLQRCDRK